MENKQIDIQKPSKEKAKRKYGTWLNILVVIVAILFANTRFICIITSPWVIPHIMQEKYHKEFKVVELGEDGTLYLETESEPGRRIMAEVEGKYPLDIKYRDDYACQHIEEYVNKWIKENAHSKYTDKVYSVGSEDIYYYTDFNNKISNMYSLSQIDQGPKDAPEAYESIAMVVHIYGTRQHLEDMVREMHDLYVAIGKQYDLKKIYMKIFVADIEILKKNPDIAAAYEKGDFSGESYIYKMKPKRGVWAFESAKSLDTEKAVSDYTYFKQCIADVKYGFEEFRNIEVIQ